MSASTSFIYPVNSWVWVKQPDYPWWPAIVLDPSQAGQDPPEGSDLLLLCGPSASATLMFANSTDAEQLRPYRSAEEDAELIEAGRSDESCAAAIEEMIAAVASTDTAPGEEVSHTSPSVSGTAGEQGNHGFYGEDGVEYEAPPTETDAALAQPLSAVDEKKHKKGKKHKKRNRHGGNGGDGHADRDATRKARKRKSSRDHHRHRSGDSDSEEAEASSGGDDDSESHGDTFQRRKEASSSRSAMKKLKYERQSKLEEYDRGPATLSDYSARHDPAYYYRKVHRARRAASSMELKNCTQKLRGCMSRCLSGAATPVDVEADVLNVLGQLKNVDVTVAQLQETGVGVAIGSLLRFFTPPVVHLAQAILNYWFHSLPQNTQQQLFAENEVDRCSIDTCPDDAAADNELGRIGVNLFSCFTNEEINDAPSSVDVMALCSAMEDALERHCDTDAQMLVLSAFGNTGDTGKALRRLFLEGKIYVEDIINNTGNLPLLIRTRQRRPPNMQLTFTSPTSHGRSDVHSPSSLYETFSPNDNGSTGSPTFDSPA
ncbi:hypothetical protein, conserved [Leishmania tarentolae]|uniref:PWWP domain-containing protein n=1 Tax=Leishmania tarentolae TaxID=5689 RepID=A0A640KS02_LEITA|nr:hypothetical protein, conserved [Leishmania tarentolae]